MASYEEVYRRSLADPDGFWLDAAGAIDWVRPPSVALDDRHPPLYRWYPDGVLNTSFKPTARHVRAGHGDRAALIHDSAYTGVRRTYSYAELLDEVARFA